MTTEYNLLSAELFAITDCVLANALMQWLPIIATPPEVDFLALLHPAQSASVYISMWVMGSWRSCFQTTLGLPLRYRPSLFSRRNDPVVGADISMQHN